MTDAERHHLGGRPDYLPRRGCLGFTEVARPIAPRPMGTAETKSIRSICPTSTKIQYTIRKATERPNRTRAVLDTSPLRVRRRWGSTMAAAANARPHAAQTASPMTEDQLAAI